MPKFESVCCYIWICTHWLNAFALAPFVERTLCAFLCCLYGELTMAALAVEIVEWNMRNWLVMTVRIKSKWLPSIFIWWAMKCLEKKWLRREFMRGMLCALPQIWQKCKWKSLSSSALTHFVHGVQTAEGNLGDWWCFVIKNLILLHNIRS